MPKIFFIQTSGEVENYEIVGEKKKKNSSGMSKRYGILEFTLWYNNPYEFKYFLNARLIFVY